MENKNTHQYSIDDLIKRQRQQDELDSLQDQLLEEQKQRLEIKEQRYKNNIAKENEAKQNAIDMINKELPQYLKEQKAIDKERQKVNRNKIDAFNNELEEYLEIDKLMEQEKIKKYKEQELAKQQEIKAKEVAYNQRHQDLDVVFNGEEFINKTKEAIMTPSQEEIDFKQNLNNNVEKAQQAYNNELNKGPIDPNTHEKLHNDILDAVTEQKNYDNLKDYERKKALYDFENLESNAELNNQRNYNNQKWEKGWRPGHEDLKALDEASEEVAEKAVKNNLKKSTFKNLSHLGNGIFTAIDYKSSREAGNGVVKSVAKAGAEFAKGELLGGWYLIAMGAKAMPTLAVNTVEGINTMSRSMNSMQKRQVFGDAQFMDTQQLATMRQSGMELAKMSQYNLQQAMMGNEAEHMHRL